MSFKSTLLSILSLTLVASASATEMKFGIDRLQEPAVAQLLQGKRIALLSHRASVDRDGRHAIDSLKASYRVMKLFVPEHGLRSDLDDWVDSGIDPVSGLPVISLYQQANREPKDSDLLDVDTIVIDLQDVGVRYYTYSSTVGAVLKKAGEKGIEVVLLDRPNPIGGTTVDGFVLPAADAGSFTSYHTVSTVHGMTLGELALMYNEELRFGARLHVIPVVGWDRTRTVRDWDRAWVPSSPALVSGDQTLLYSLWGALEGANLAVGRGTDNGEAFRRIGAPWITKSGAEAIAEDMRARFPGMEFKSVEWTVTRATHVGKTVRGISASIRDFAQLPNPTEFLVWATQSLKRHYPNDLVFNNVAWRSYGSQRMLADILALRPLADLRAQDATSFDDFVARRARFVFP